MNDQLSLTDQGQELEVPLIPAEWPLARHWDERLASWISNLLSPPLVALSGIFLAACKIGTPSAWLWALYSVGLTILLPVVYIVWKMKQGEISDFHIRQREQRIRPMLLTLGSATIAWASLWLGHAPELLLIFAGMGIFQIGFFLLVTMTWKISGHGTAISSLAVFLWAIYGGAAGFSLLAIPLVAWARIRLHRHTLLQTIAGSAAGIAFMGVVLLIINRNCHGINTFCL